MPSNSSVKYQIDIAAATAHLTALNGGKDPGAEVFQVFHDPSKGKNGAAVLPLVWGDATVAEIEAWIARDYGVFITVNKTDGEGRKTRNAVECRALWIEVDAKDFTDPQLPRYVLERLNEAFPPDLVVESSPGNFHIYWLNDGSIPGREDKWTTFDRLMEGLGVVTGGDKNARDVVRVLRLAGAWWQKGDMGRAPFQSRIVQDTRVAGACQAAAREVDLKTALDAFLGSPEAAALGEYVGARRAKGKEKKARKRQGAGIGALRPLSYAGYHAPYREAFLWLLRNWREDRKVFDHGHSEWTNAGFDDGEETSILPVGYALRAACHPWYDEADGVVRTALMEALTSCSVNSSVDGLYDYTEEQVWHAHGVNWEATVRDGSKCGWSFAFRHLVDPAAVDDIFSTIGDDVSDEDREDLRENMREASRWVRIDEARKRFIYVQSMNKLWDMEKGVLVSPEVFNNTDAGLKIAPHGTKGVESAWSRLANAGRRAADSLTYRPRQPAIVRELASDEDCVNTWRRSVDPIQGATADVWVRHGMWLFGEKQFTRLSKWLAYHFRHSCKIGWSPIIVGPQGVGKDAFFAPIRHALGFHNVACIEFSQLTARFNADWATKEFIIVNEASSKGDRNRTPASIYNDIKTLFSSLPPTRAIEQKNQPIWHAPNIQNGGILTNHWDAIALEPDDRRFDVYQCLPSERPDNSLEFFGPYFAWCPRDDDASFEAHAKRQKAAGEVLGYLASLDLADFNPEEAEMSDAKRRMIGAHLPRNATTTLTAAFEEDGAFEGWDVIQVQDAVAQLRREGFMLDARAAAEILKEHLGWTRKRVEKGVYWVKGVAMHLSPKDLATRLENLRNSRPVPTVVDVFAGADTGF